MKRTISNLLLIIIMAFVLGILTGCAQKEENIVNIEDTKNEVVEESVESENRDEETVESKEEKLLSEYDAKKLLQEKYDYALKVYNLELFDYDSSEFVNLDTAEGTFYIIRNYENIASNFTEKGESDLIENHGLLFEENGNHFIILGGIPEAIDRSELLDVEIKSDEIIGTYKVDVWHPEERIVTDDSVEFIIKLEDDKWLIDTFYTAGMILNKVEGGE